MTEVCLKCLTPMLVDPDVVLTSHPPRPVYYCPNCSGLKPTYVPNNPANNPAPEPVVMPADTVLGLSSGRTLKLNPFDDLTASELYKLLKWEKFAELNPSLSADDLYSDAVRRGLKRHFEDM